MAVMISTSTLILSLSATPYLALTAYDIYLHKNDRVVPKIEKILHTILFIFLPTFILFSILGYSLIAAAFATIALPIMIADELLYHQHLDKHEKIVHVLAGLSLFAFVTTWLAYGDHPWMT